MPINEWYVPPKPIRYSIIEITKETPYSPDPGFPRSKPSCIEAKSKNGSIYYLNDQGILSDSFQGVWVSEDHAHINRILSILRDITSIEQYEYSVIAL